MLDRIAVLLASPVATFLALLLQLLLSFGVSETEAELDAIMLVEHAVVLSDDTLGDLTSVEPGNGQQQHDWGCLEGHTGQSRLPC